VVMQSRALGERDSSLKGKYLQRTYMKPPTAQTSTSAKKAQVLIKSAQTKSKR
jgi:hypothetical protein